MSTFLNSAVVISAIVGTACVAGATPTFTTINNNSGEVSQAGLFHSIYGGTWSTLPDGRSLTNGVITGTRVADDGVASPLDIFSSTATSADDKAWSGGQVSFTAEAKFAADHSNFGWINDAPASLGGSGFQQILSTSSLDTPVTLTLSSNFRWALNDLVTAQTLTSRPSDNPGGVDQMATYRITGLSAAPTWVIVWEDRTTGSDRDFNDSAIQISSVPTPGAPVLAGLGALFMTRRRRR